MSQARKDEEGDEMQKLQRKCRWCGQRCPRDTRKSGIFTLNPHTRFCIYELRGLELEAKGEKDFFNKQKQREKREGNERQLLGKVKELVKRKVCYLRDWDTQCISIPKPGHLQEKVEKSAVSVSQESQGA